MKNDKYDEAVDVSQSMDQSNIAVGKDHRSPNRNESLKTGHDRRDSENSMSFGVLNKPFDEALEFSQSESEKSVETKGSDDKRRKSSNEPDGILPTSESKSLGMSPSQSGLQYSKPVGAPLLSNLPAKQSLAAQQVGIFIFAASCDGSFVFYCYDHVAYTETLMQCCFIVFSKCA